MFFYLPSHVLSFAEDPTATMDCSPGEQMTCWVTRGPHQEIGCTCKFTARVPSRRPFHNGVPTRRGDRWNDRSESFDSSYVTWNRSLHHHDNPFARPEQVLPLYTRRLCMRAALSTTQLPACYVADACEPDWRPECEAQRSK